MVARVKALVAWVQALLPVRVFQHYSSKRGPILASGLAYQALFAVFAGIWVLFSIAGLVLAGDATLTDTLVDALGNAVPGLIDTGDGSGGAIDPTSLLQTTSFSWTGIIALAATLLTALGFMASTREAVRSVFGMPTAGGNAVLAKAKDLGYLVGILVLLILSTALSVGGIAATTWMLGLLGISQDSVIATIAGRVVALALVVAIDALIVGLLLSVVAGTGLGLRQVRAGALIGGVGIAVLTAAFQLGILGGASKNPLLASFVVILGLLVFFNFLCQVVLIAASWTAVTAEDAGHAIGAQRMARMPAGSRAAGDRPRQIVARAAVAPPAPGLFERLRRRVGRRP